MRKPRAGKFIFKIVILRPGYKAVYNIRVQKHIEREQPISKKYIFLAEKDAKVKRIFL